MKEKTEFWDVVRIQSNDAIFTNDLSNSKLLEGYEIKKQKYLDQDICK